MPEEVRARLILALLGLVFGLVPLIYACIRRLIVPGVASLVICAVISAVGLPYLSVILAAGAFYLIYALAGKRDAAQQKKNRAAYRKLVKDLLNSSDVRFSGYIENKDKAGSAWPPVDSYVDEYAVKEYEKLAESEEYQRTAEKASEANTSDAAEFPDTKQ